MKFIKLTDVLAALLTANPYGAGNPYSTESPNNPYGTALRNYGQ